MSTGWDEIGLTLGGEDLRDCVSELKWSDRLNALSEAEFRLDTNLLRDRALDWQGEVVITLTASGERIFTGVVVSALPDTSQAESGTDSAIYNVKCINAGVSLMESAMPSMHYAGLAAPDLFHVLARSAGWPANRVVVEGSEDLPHDVFEIVVDVMDIEVKAPTRVGGVTFMSGQSVPSTLTAFFADNPIVEGLRSARTVAVALAGARGVQDAMEDGLSQIDLAIAWVRSRAQDGTFVRASRHWPFLRANTLPRPARGELIIARGFGTGRVLIRTSAPPTPLSGALQLSPNALVLAPPMPSSLTTSERLAVLAWQRAAEPGVFEQRVQSMWDALEFYAVGVRAPEVFDDAARSQIRQTTTSLPLTRLQLQRLRQMVSQLNQPPLLARIRAAAEIDGVPLSPGEGDVLSRLRRVRNRATHGSGPADARQQEHGYLEEDLRHALSVVARLLGARATRHVQGPSRGGTGVP